MTTWRRSSCPPARAADRETTPITRLPRSATCRSITAARLSKPIRSYTIKKRSDCARRTPSGSPSPTARSHIWQSHRSDRRLSRRICRFIATRNARRDSFCRRSRRPYARQLHRSAERRLYRLRTLQGRSAKAAAMAGQGRPHHPHEGEKMLYFEERKRRVFRGTACLCAVHVDPRSDC